MFGIKQLQQQRDHLYKRTQLLEKQAKVSRDKALNSSLNKASSPEGLLASFLLGASTQCDLTKKARENLLNTASKDLVNFVTAQCMTASSTDNNSSQKTGETKAQENL